MTRGTHGATFLLGLAVACAVFLALRADESKRAAEQLAAEARMRAELGERDAVIADLQQQLEAARRRPAPVRTEVAPAPEPSPGVADGTADAGPPDPPAAPPASPPGTALAWLQDLLPVLFDGAPVASVADVKELDLRGAAITDADLARLAELPALQSLNLRGTAITDAGLHNLASLQRLESLCLRGCQVDGSGLGALPPGLRHLDLTDTRAGPGVLLSMPHLPQLTTLKLNWLSVTDADLDALPRWTQLRHLEIDGTQVTGEGLRLLLARMPDLRRLEVRDVTVAADVLDDLLRRYPHLELVTQQGRGPVGSLR